MNAKKSVSFMSVYDDSFNTSLANKQSVDWNMLSTVQRMCSSKEEEKNNAMAANKYFFILLFFTSVQRREMCAA